eukprot:12211013-Alexandrium_andersonii.AAC.1
MGQRRVRPQDVLVAPAVGTPSLSLAASEEQLVRLRQGVLVPEGLYQQRLVGALRPGRSSPP